MEVEWMISERSAKCVDCGGELEFKPRPDTTREWKRGIIVSLPDDQPVWSCKNCREIFLDAADGIRLDEAISKTWNDMVRIINEADGRHEID